MPGKRRILRRQTSDTVAKQDLVLRAFEKLWKDLFESPVHLDSLLSKQSSSFKSILAQIVPTLLLRPASQAEALGIGVPSGEPWSLSPSAQGRWRPARIAAEKIYKTLSERPMQPAPSVDDFPPGMIEEWERDWGKETRDRLIETLATEAPLGLRVARKFPVTEVLQGLKAGSKLPVSAKLSDLSPQGIRLGGYAPVLGSEWYEKGALEIQDEGSQLLSFFALWPELFGARLLPAPGPITSSGSLPHLPSKPLAWTVIDACAGAGGKSLAIADALQGRGRVYAYDTSDQKLQALRRRAKRAGLNNIQTLTLVEGEESKALEKFTQSADLVLVDAPCTGWGVLRRNPDIKWRQKHETLERMPAIQKRLLSLYSELVKPCGRLVYGLCTFRKTETLDVVREFSEAHPAFVAKEGGFLGPGPCDGFFMQAFERRAQAGVFAGRKYDKLL